MARVTVLARRIRRSPWKYYGGTYTVATTLQPAVAPSFNQRMDRWNSQPTSALFRDRLKAASSRQVVPDTDTNVSANPISGFLQHYVKDFARSM
jgi:hypothetical protein